jgi:hypothetical protein
MISTVGLKLVAKSCLCWPIWSGVEAAIVLISQKKNHTEVWLSVRPSWWCMVCLVWFRDEALNALKKWPPEQLSMEKMMKKMNNLFFYCLGKKEHRFDKNTSFYKNKMMSF